MILNNIYDKKIKELYINNPKQCKEEISKLNFDSINVEKITKDDLLFLIEINGENNSEKLGYKNFLDKCFVVELNKEHQDVSLILKLIEAGVDVNWQDKYGNTALMDDSGNEHTEIENKLRESGKVRNAASKHQNITIIKQIIDLFRSPNNVNYSTAKPN